jgi:hypothetical protein
MVVDMPLDCVFQEIIQVITVTIFLTQTWVNTFSETRMISLILWAHGPGVLSGGFTPLNATSGIHQGSRLCVGI